MNKERILEAMRETDRSIKDLANMFPHMSESDVRVYLRRLQKDRRIYLAGYRGKERIFAVSEDFSKDIYSLKADFPNYPDFAIDYGACQWVMRFYTGHFSTFLASENLKTIIMFEYESTGDPLFHRVPLVIKGLLECPPTPSMELITKGEFKASICEYFRTKCPGIYFRTVLIGERNTCSITKVIPTLPPASTTLQNGPILEISPLSNAAQQSRYKCVINRIEYAGTQILPRFNIKNDEPQYNQRYEKI